MSMTHPTRKKGGFFLLAVVVLAISSCSDGGCVTGPLSDCGDIGGGTASISGTVSAGGLGISGALVSLTGPGSGAKTTDASGSFSFVTLVAGTYTLSLSGVDPSLFSIAPALATVTVADGEAVTSDFAGTSCLAGAVSFTAVNSGSFASGDCTTPAGAFFDSWTMSVPTEMSYGVKLTTPDVDSLDVVLALNDSTGTELIRVDDVFPLIDQNSQVLLTLSPGEFVLRAETFATNGDTGPYSLQVIEIPNGVAELVADSTSTAAAAQVGGSLFVDMYLTNTGPLSAGTFSVGVRASLDQQPSPDDVDIGGCDVDSLAPGADFRCFGSVNLPTLAAGTYFVWMYADAFNSVLEPNERDNVLFSPILLTITN